MIATNDVIDIYPHVARATPVSSIPFFALAVIATSNSKKMMDERLVRVSEMKFDRVKRKTRTRETFN